MWHILTKEGQVQAWKTIFGHRGERGEYMDGYTEQAMFDRCEQDYKWGKKFMPEEFLTERAMMMAHLYDNRQLYKSVSMVGFAEHYVLGASVHDEVLAKPFDTFQRHKRSQPADLPIFGGVVLSGWQRLDLDAVEQKLKAFKEAGVDYVRLECNLGSADEIGDPAQIANNPKVGTRLCRLAEVAHLCQMQEMVPLVLLQVPWREPEEGSSDAYFRQAVDSFAAAAKGAQVNPRGLLFETRPPMAVSAQQERGLAGTAKTSLGLTIGQRMFEVIDGAFDGCHITGFCVAGGSTKGDLPQAMEDDTQNAVRQGIRRCAQRRWGFDACFFEMGAKLMLQPKVGRLWKQGPAGRDAAKELFCLNAEDIADEISEGIL